MNDKKDLELFYIYPHTIDYNSGGYYRNDDTGCINYRSPSKHFIYSAPLIFDNKEQLFNWFYKNAGKIIPTVYRIKYIANYQGLDDVIKATNLTTGGTYCLTPLNKEVYVAYDAKESKEYSKFLGYDAKESEENNKFFWVNEGASYNSIFKFEYIYEELSKRGIKIKHNVYEQDIDKTNCFEYIGDPYRNKKEAEGKKLILYYPYNPFL